MRFKVGDRVKTVENHEYLKISKRMIGTVSGINDFPDSGTIIFVKFKNKRVNRNIGFGSVELRKIKRK